MEAHLLKTNDRMETHNLPEVAKVQRFSLILTGEAKLWYGTFKTHRSRLDMVTRTL